MQEGSRAQEDENVILGILRRCVERGIAPAIESAGGTVSYGELGVLVRSHARHLAAHGVGPGKVVAMSFDDETGLTLCMLAVLHLGAAIFVVPRSTPQPQRLDLLARARADLLVSDGDHRLTAPLPKLRIDRTRIPGAGPGAPDPEPSPDGPAIIIAGSGSTGVPRLLPVLHRHLHFRIRIQNERFGLSEDAPDRVFMTSHIEYPSAAMRVFGALTIGSSVLFADKSSAERIHDAITRQAVTVALGTVLHVEQVLAVLPKSTRDAWRGLRVLGITSSTVSDALRARIRQHLTDRLYIVYGTNESMSMAVSDPETTFRTPGTVGRPSPGVRIELVDAQDRPVPRGSVGLIRARSPAQIEGYLDDPGQTARSFRDGWFYPGDLGRFTDDGQIVFCGRADDMMILNGINLYPAEIEQCLTSHPAVRDAAVLPFRHPVHQDVPFAVVSLHEGHAVDPEELRRYAAGRIGFRAPRRILFLPEIPRNQHGKLDRPELQRQVLALPEVAELVRK